MCCFATRSSIDFNIAMLRFVAAHAGLIAPQPGRTHFNLFNSATDVLAEHVAAPGNAVAHDAPRPGAATNPHSARGCHVAVVDAREPVGSDGASCDAAGRRSFNLGACSEMVAPVERGEGRA